MTLYRNTSYRGEVPMTKPTGRPRGRPKTKEYVTLMARVDVDLADRVKRYASLHRQPLSVVLRDALTLLMDEYPSGAELTAPHRVAEHDFLSDRYESPLDTLVGETDSAGLAELLSDTNNFAIEKIMSDTNRGIGYMSDIKGDEERASDTQRDKRVSDTNAAVTEPVSDAHRDTAKVSGMNAGSSLVPTPYDPDAASARIHTLHTQGQSFRRIADQLNTEGMPTRRGGPWNQSSVRYLLETHGG
jgi:hypothetical protein